MKFLRALTAVSLIALTTGCANGLNTAQESELGHYRAKNLAVEEKTPALAAGLGVLPGGGSFYGRSYGLGVLNLITWPLSMFWDPISGYNAAESINYQATKANVSRLKERDMRDLDAQMDSGEIDLKRYIQKKRRIDEKYIYNM